MERRTTRPDEHSGRGERPGEDPASRPPPGDDPAFRPPPGDDPAFRPPPGDDPAFRPPPGDDPLADAADGRFDPYGSEWRDPFSEPRAEQHGSAPGSAPRPDLSALFVLVDALRRGLPPELREQFTALIREALLTLRSLIDWYLERLDRRPPETKVEDIPID